MLPCRPSNHTYRLRFDFSTMALLHWTVSDMCGCQQSRLERTNMIDGFDWLDGFDCCTLHGHLLLNGGG